MVGTTHICQIKKYTNDQFSIYFHLCADNINTDYIHDKPSKSDPETETTVFVSSRFMYFIGSNTSSAKGLLNPNLFLYLVSQSKEGAEPKAAF